MLRTITVFVAVALSVPAFGTEGITLWGCAPEGQRRSVLYLADRGTQSYVKFGTQRISAELSAGETERRWSFGDNYVSLDQDDVAEYYENGTLKARFKCRMME